MEIDKMQYAFVSGRETIDAILIVRQLQEKILVGNRKMYLPFVDLEKAYDKSAKGGGLLVLEKKRGVRENSKNSERNV